MILQAYLLREIIDEYLQENGGNMTNYVVGQPLVLREYLQNHCHCDTELVEMLVMYSYEDIRQNLPTGTMKIFAVISRMFCERKYDEGNSSSCKATTSHCMSPKPILCKFICMEPT